MNLQLPLLSFVVLSLILQIEGQIIHEIIPEAITENTDYDGWPSAYEREYFNITGHVYLNLTNDDTHNVKVQVILPSVAETITTCDTLIDGSQTSCSTSTTYYSPIYVNENNAKVTFGEGLGSSSEPTVVKKDNYIVEFEIADLFSNFFNTSDFNSSAVTDEEKVFVTVPGYIKARDPNSLYEIVVKTLLNDVEEVEEESTKVRKVGPFMTALISASPSWGVEAGDVVSYTVRFQHLSAISTENASNVQVSVAINSADQAPGVSGSVVYITPGGSFPLGGNDTADMEAGIAVGDVNTDGFYTLTFDCNATDNLLLNSDLELAIDLRFDGTDSGRSYSYSYLHHLPTATVNFTVSAEDIMLPPNFPVGATMKIKKLFSIPKGKLDNFAFFADFFSTELDSLPFTFTSGVITHENYVQFSESHGGVLTTADFITSGSRKRRSADEEHGRFKRAATSLGVTGNFGDIINPAAGGISGSPMELLDVVPRRCSPSVPWLLLLLLLLLRLSPALALHPSSSPSSWFHPVIWGLALQVQFTVGDVPEGGTVLTDTGLDVNGNTLYLSRQLLATVNRPSLSINKTVEMVDALVLPNIVRFNVTVEHTLLSGNDAFEVELKDGEAAFDVYFYDGYIGPPPTDPEFTVIDHREMVWKKGSLGTSEYMYLSYKAQPSDKGKNLPQGTSSYEASVTYNSAAGGTGDSYTETSAVCIEKQELTKEDVFVEYGFTVLALICGILFGALIVALVLFLCYKCRREMPFTSVRPASEVDESYEVDYENQRYDPLIDDVLHEEVYRETSKGLMTDPASFRKKKGFNTIKDLSMVDASDSIVMILALKDKMKRHRELDNQDIVSTIHVDENIDNERNQAMIDGTILLVNTLRQNGDITKATEEKAVQTFRKNIAELEKSTNKDFEKDLEALLKKLGAKNQQKLSNLMEKQQDEKDAMEEKVSTRTPEEQKELLSLLDQQQQTEREELAHRLKLEQNEETEKLRKEYTIRKRMGIKSLQQDFLDNVKKTGELNAHQADWLMKEHFRTQAALEKIFDDEISRQRMTLEEKLARRKAMAAASEQQEEHHSETLNTLASQQLQAIQRAKKEGALSSHEARALMESLQKEMLETKEKMDRERERQEQTLHKRLGEKKKQRMEALAKKHNQEVNDLQKTQKSQQTDGAVDPASFLEAKETLISNHRAEMNNLENEIDQEHADELMKLREGLADQTKAQLTKRKDDLIHKLQSQGMSESQLNKLLAKHNRELEDLRDAQQSERQRQEAHFQERLARNRRQWSQQQGFEEQEQEALRSHEEAVVRKLMDNQVAMSEQERDRILQEHEKQMVKLENSLTLNKLQQKRMLEDKLAQRRSQQLEKLQKKQQLENKKRRRSAAGDEEMDEEDREQSQMDMMKKHAEQRLAILQGEKLKIEDEVDEVREEMMRERANALKEQEVKLGAMLAQLQIDKAKEMAKIEEQQKAIHNLKSNLMDDLNDKGVLSDPECQRVIEIHQAEQEKLNKSLEAQRAKQEKKLYRRLKRRVDDRQKRLELEHFQQLLETEPESEQLLRKKMAERLKQKEQRLSQLHEQQIRESGDGAPSSTAAKLRKMALMTRHMTEMEQFRNRMEKEISQTLEELRRQNDMRRLQVLQDQEIQFLNGLVRLGKFKVNELDNVIHMLFPTKTEQEHHDLLAKLTEGYQAPPESETEGEEVAISPRGLNRQKSTLEARALSTTLAMVENEVEKGQYKGRQYYSFQGGQQGLTDLMQRSSKAKKGGKKRFKGGRKKLPSLSREYDYDYDDNRYSSQRPDPVGRSYSPDGFNETDKYSRVPPTRLPPMQSSLKKKKKLKKASVTYSDEASF